MPSPPNAPFISAPFISARSIWPSSRWVRPDTTCTSGIVVIRDNKRNKSLTLRSGDKVNNKLVIKTVRRNQVVLASGDDRFYITYAGSKVDKTEPIEEPNLEKLYEEQMRLLEDQDIDGNEVIHVFEDGVYKNEDGSSDRSRLWRPVRTGDNLKYVIKEENSETPVVGNRDGVVRTEETERPVLDEDYEEY